MISEKHREKKKSCRRKIRLTNSAFSAPQSHVFTTWTFQQQVTHNIMQLLLTVTVENFPG